MRNPFLHTLLPLLLVILVQCGQKEDPGLLQMEADSLLVNVMDLQQRLGSPEIQRLHDFEDEINEDLILLYEDTSLVKYLDLYNSLGHCMDACSQFHEEAFLLESSLRDILDQIGREDGDPDKLKEQLAFEHSVYDDLYQRVDSSMNIVMKQAEMFYSLKPEIESLKQSRNAETPVQ